MLIILTRQNGQSVGGLFFFRGKDFMREMQKKFRV